ncbi:MAG TPA: ABC transporter ATP-binding protein, partial [Bacillota bacterium]|nr:ABC transporter ATP-binding protein [Bacillota bacterium]
MPAEAKAMPNARHHLRPKAKKGTFLRLIKTLFKFYPVLLPVTIVCILFSSTVSAIPSLFVQKIIQIIEQNHASGDWETAFSQILPLVLVLASFYLLSLLSMLLYT